MGLESATLIHELDPANPVGGSDPKSQGDDHIRMFKAAVQNTFPNVEGVVTASHAELNILDGVTATAAELNKMDGFTGSATDLNNILSRFGGLKIAFCTGNASASPSGGNFVDTTKANKNCTGTHTNSSGIYVMDYTAAGFTRAPAVFIITQNPNVSAGVSLKQVSVLPTITTCTYILENLSAVNSDAMHWFVAIGD
jgi:hypothetical protein